MENRHSNCWEVTKCGREEGGTHVAELGVCPAYTAKAGRACWLVAGTFCNGAVQGTQAQKAGTCLICDFYRQFDLAHRSAVRRNFAHLLNQR